MISRSIVALAAASFGIGTTEFVIMGLLPDVASSLHAPIVAIATARLPRKTALLVLMAVFIIGNLGCALAPSYGALMAARIVTAFAHGAFFGIGAVVASDLVPREQRAQAISLMFTGLTLANVLGVPFGTALGQIAGWRAAFWAVVAIGIVAGAAIARYIPIGLAGSRGSLAGEFRTLGRWPVLLPMLISTLASVSMFSLFTYIAPLLEDVTGISPRGVTGVLLMIGIGLTIGNLLGGRLADRNLLRTVAGVLAGLIAVLVMLYFASRSIALTLPLLILWGGLAFALVSPLQIWVVDAATDAPNLASTLNQGAFNLGNASGAWLGGVILTAGADYQQLPLVGAVVAIIALALTLMVLINPRMLPVQIKPAE
jgi:DHA1 family inner membrane transport protein